MFQRSHSFVAHAQLPVFIFIEARPSKAKSSTRTERSNGQPMEKEKLQDKVRAIAHQNGKHTIFCNKDIFKQNPPSIVKCSEW